MPDRRGIAGADFRRRRRERRFLRPHFLHSAAG
jgi:hypothetical protein